MTHRQWRPRRKTWTAVPKEVMQQLTDLAAETEGTADRGETYMPWTDEEELISSIDLRALGSPRAERPYGQEWRFALRFLAMCGAAASLIAILCEYLRSSGSRLRPHGSKKASSCADDLS